MRKLFLGFEFTAFVLLSVGCSQPVPSMAGGKPVSYWHEKLQDPDAKVRKSAVMKLGNVSTADPAAIPALVGMLRDPDAKVRRETIQALLKSGTNAGEAIPILSEMQKSDRDADVRDCAAKALKGLR